jgi:hypothetical protein
LRVLSAGLAGVRGGIRQATGHRDEKSTGEQLWREEWPLRTPSSSAQRRSGGRVHPPVAVLAGEDVVSGDDRNPHLPVQDAPVLNSFLRSRELLEALVDTDP